jgi:hypothetical protein
VVVCRAAKGCALVGRDPLFLSGSLEVEVREGPEGCVHLKEQALESDKG